MKDMYAFDTCEENAKKTYEAVKRAYTNLFDKLGVNYAIAQADSGNIGKYILHSIKFLLRRRSKRRVSHPFRRIWGGFAVKLQQM
jgi:prolyl-tRNA synthetase